MDLTKLFLDANGTPDISTNTMHHLSGGHCYISFTSDKSYCYFYVIYELIYHFSS